MSCPVLSFYAELPINVDIIHKTLSYYEPRSGTKYLALEEFLMDKTEKITLTFIEINEIIGEKLPVPSDSAVFKAGYKVEKIDFKTKSVIFSKID